MTQQQIKEVQEKFLQMQSQIQETVVSGNGDITVVFDGNVQITNLIVTSNKSIEQLQPVLVETINKGIKLVSEKIRNAMLLLQQQIQQPN
jgi:DNA-binding protein YbaB